MALTEKMNRTDFLEAGGPEHHLGKIEDQISLESETYQAGSVLDRKLITKQDKRIIPLSAGIYLLCYLDRSNIGKFTPSNAQITIPLTYHR